MRGQTVSTLRTDVNAPMVVATVIALWSSMVTLERSWAQDARQSPREAAPAGATLRRAAEQGDMALLERRLSAGDPVDACDERGRTPLHLAVIGGHLSATTLLLDRGADPNARAEGDMTPLHYAAMLPRPELAGLLTRRGARTDVRNASGMMPLHLAADDKVVRVLAAAGADVNGRTSDGLTPLHTARHGLVARTLVDLKADLRIRSPKGRTPMEIASVETFERQGLSMHSVMLGRLRGIIGQMPVTLTNVSSRPILDLALSARSSGCSVDVTPPAVAQLLPGQNASYVLTLMRNAKAAPGEYPIDLTLSVGGSQIGKADLKVDTRRIVTPEDRGMIRLARGRIRPASSRWFYLVYAVTPLLILAVWLHFRRR